ncbi:MAG: hypothetical protein ABSD51_04280 [Candidatus Binatus sp.]
MNACEYGSNAGDDPVAQMLIEPDSENLTRPAVYLDDDPMAQMLVEPNAKNPAISSIDPDDPVAQMLTCDE